MAKQSSCDRRPSDTTEAHTGAHSRDSATHFDGETRRHAPRSYFCWRNAASCASFVLLMVKRGAKTGGRTNGSDVVAAEELADGAVFEHGPDRVGEERG